MLNVVNNLQNMFVFHL